MQRIQWIDLSGYEGYYQINKQGHIRSLYKRNYLQPLSTKIDRGGYYTVQLSKKGKTTTQWLHRLMATAFIPNPDNKSEVNHKDGDKLNNELSNLEWVTHAENVAHAYRHGLNSAAKKIVDKINGTVYNSIREAANAIGMNYNTCCKHLVRNRPNFHLRYL